MSDQTTWRSDGDAWAEAGIRGAVVVAHGGQSVTNGKLDFWRSLDLRIDAPDVGEMRI